MKIFITGATGYLGENIVRQAVAQGHQVRALCREFPDSSAWEKSVEAVRGNILDVASLRENMQGCDAVIHTAGLVSIWQRDPDVFRKINLEGSRNVLQIAAQCGIDRIVYTSSFFALGPTREAPATEDWLYLDQDGYSPTPYAQSKYDADRWVRNWVQDGHDVITVYPVLIYGPGKPTQGNHITRMIHQYIHRKLPGIPGKGTFRWTFSYVEDVAKGHLLALTKGKRGGRYILGGEDATLIEFFDILHALTQIKPPRIKIPLSLLKTVGHIERILAFFSRGYIPQVTPDTVDVYHQHWRYSSQKAIAELGYTRTPLKAGILKTLESLEFQHPSERNTSL